MPALRGFVSFSRNTLASFGALRSSILNPGVLSRASTQLNLKFTESALCNLRRVGICSLSILTTRELDLEFINYFSLQSKNGGKTR